MAKVHLRKQSPKRNKELVITSPTRVIRTKLGITCFVGSDFTWLLYPNLLRNFMSKTCTILTHMNSIPVSRQREATHWDNPHFCRLVV